MIRDFLDRKKSIAVVGLGYVGLPLAFELAKHFPVFGFDSDRKRIKELRDGFDSTGEISGKKLRASTIEFTPDPRTLRRASLVIITVPTPIDEYTIPDLSALKAASETVGKNLRKGAVVVYESTVYPGVTEDICIPLLENYSGLKCGKDFRVGYSPERVNPGDRKHGIADIVKIVSAQDKRTVTLMSRIYGTVVKAGIHRAPDIRTAEAAKVIENIQRDLNIAFINELAIIFNIMGIDTQQVLSAASTKWNFLPFQPGLVGGHCIGVDPYYLTFKSQSLGYHPEVILAGRRINDNMGKYVATNTIKQLISSGRPVKKSRVLILGLTFKENINDVRNTRVVDICKDLRGYGVRVFVYDPHVDTREVSETYGMSLIHDPEENKPYDGIIVAVKHKEFRRYSLGYLKKLCKENPVLIDIKSFFAREKAVKSGFRYWRL